MRLIDADRLKSYIDCGHLRPPTEVCFSEFDVCNMVDKQPTIEAVQGWIPCSERLPKENGEYIVSLEDSVYPWARFFNGKWFMLPINAIAREFGEYEVIAWMPLPKPIQRGW